MHSLNKRKDLGDFLNSLGLNRFGVEVGVFRGDFADTILSQWNGKQLFLVDQWGSGKRMQRVRQRTYDRFREDSRVIIYEGSSMEMSKSFEDNTLDWVYIDAAHDYKNVSIDLLSWYPKVRSGGLVAGHDYTNDNTRREEYGVRDAVDDFVRLLVYPELFVTNEGRKSSWYFIKG